MKNRHRRGDGGFTLVELMVTTGVMVIALTLLIGATISLATQTKVSEMRVTALNFNTSVIETVRERAVDRILQYNYGDLDLDTHQGVIEIEGLEGLGTTKIALWVMVPTGAMGTSSTRVDIPVSDARLAELMSIGTPNPIEFHVEITIDRGLGTGNEYKFHSAGMLYYL